MNNKKRNASNRHIHVAHPAWRAGYTGLEIAPFTLGDERPAALRRQMADAGLEFARLHALLTAPPGLHITTPDDAVRRRSWEHLRRLIDRCAGLGPDSVMVVGSGKQRSAAGGSTVADATARLRDGLAALAPIAHSRRVTILLEPLAPHLADVVTTLEQAAAIVREVNHPGLQTMFDTHNTAGETLPADELLRRYYPWIRHVHLNEMDGKRPGAGNYDFRPVLRALRELRYDRWLSVEVFDFAEGGERIAEESARYLRKVEVSL